MLVIVYDELNALQVVMAVCDRRWRCKGQWTSIRIWGLRHIAAKGVAVNFVVAERDFIANVVGATRAFVVIETQALLLTEMRSGIFLLDPRR